MLDYISINAHSSIRIESGKVLYFDPFHIHSEKHDADVIFVTHDHYDHFSPEDISKIIKDETIFVAPASTAKLIRDAFSGWDVVVMAPGDKKEVAGIDVEAVASYNPAKNFHPKAQNWVGYVVTVEGMRHYICGDMDVTEEGKNVSCDVLLLPCGGTYTMDIAEALTLVEAISPKYAIPTHYGDIVGESTCGRTLAGMVKNRNLAVEVITKI